MSSVLDEFRSVFERESWPEGFLEAYEPLSRLSHGERGETFIVRGRADDALYIAKLSSGDCDESEILKKLSHPGLPRFVARFGEEGARAVVREYVEGVTLEETARRGPLPEARVVSIGIQLCARPRSQRCGCMNPCSAARVGSPATGLGKMRGDALSDAGGRGFIEL